MFARGSYPTKNINILGREDLVFLELTSSGLCHHWFLEPQNGISKVF